MDPSRSLLQGFYKDSFGVLEQVCRDLAWVVEALCQGLQGLYENSARVYGSRVSGFLFLIPGVVKIDALWKALPKVVRGAGEGGGGANATQSVGL